MSIYNDKKLIKEHYDLVSPYYHRLWGEHLHHGYWSNGQETKEEAQINLIKYLSQRASIKPNSSILDVGCGFGGSSIYLSKKYNAETIGITISQVQVDMAAGSALKADANSKFILMDAEEMNFKQPFDVIWSIESISHYENKEKFFARAIKLLKPDGTLAIIDWFKRDNLSAKDSERFIKPIEKGMLVELKTMNEYKKIFENNGLKITSFENISKNCAKTWDISLDIIKNRDFWNLAFRHGSEFVKFLRSFKAMKAGFASNNFVYGLIVAKK